MPLDNLSDLSAVLLAISLATERLVVIVKTVFPKLGEERPPEPGESSDEADRMRRLSVLGVAYVCALATAWLIADGWTIEYGAGKRAISIFGLPSTNSFMLPDESRISSMAGDRSLGRVPGS